MATRELHHGIADPSTSRQRSPQHHPVFDRWRGERPWPACALPPGAREEDSFHHEPRTISPSLVKHEALVIAGLIGGLVVVAVVLALAMSPLGGMAGLMLVALLAVYAALLTAPVWIATISEDVEQHADQSDEG